ncbi:MAG: right-handed parallel beta-helix repeat-containing protein [Thermoplasmata archaeon]|nr:MAG: right-handed parallel beta-helix repeat-containing protein [Thermoplasmata archaeon]
MFSVKIKKSLMSAYLIFAMVSAGFIGMLIFEGVVDEGGVEAAPTTIIVDINGGGDYTKIQDAINKANSGDTIRVWAGTYYENVVVNRTVTLIGNGTGNTTINGGGTGDVVYVSSNWVNITRFTLTNSGSFSREAGIKLINVKNCYIANNNCSLNNRLGITIDSTCSYIRIENNTCNNNLYPGIGAFTSSSHIIIKNNTCLSNSNGIVLGPLTNNNSIENNTCNSNNFYGIDLVRSTCNLIKNNTCNLNSEGIWLDTSSWNIVKNNTCNENKQDGILLKSSSSSNKIINNTISSNKVNGIRLKFSNNNLIYHNIFINNTNHANDNTKNFWNATYPIGGNSWDNWTTPDNNKDGFVDKPFIISGGINKDYLPLTNVSLLNGSIYNVDKKIWYPRIQLAVNDADPGNTIRVWAGDYSELVTINKPLTLIGNGSANTTIIGDRTGNVVYVTADWVNISGFKVKNGSINGFVAGIKLYSAQNCRIESCNVTDNNYGILMEKCSNNIIRNNTSYDNRNGALSFRTSSNNNNIYNNFFKFDGMGFSDTCTGNVITNNTIINGNFGVSYTSGNIIKNNSLTKGGFSLNGNKFKHYTGNTVHMNNTVNGKPVVVLDSQVGGNVSVDSGQIYLVNCTNVIVENQNCTNAYYGIYLFSSNNNYIRNNTVNDNAGRSIYLYRSSYNRVINNTILNNNYGINIQSYSDHNIIANNEINNSNYPGIELAVSSFNRIENNSVNYTHDHGINIDSGSKYNVLDNNTSNHNFFYGVEFLYDSHFNTIKNSISNHNRQSGLHITYGSSGCTVENNTFNYNRWNGMSAYDSIGNTIINNNCSENNESGIYLYYNGEYNILINNTCTLNTLYGIYVNSPGNTFEDNYLRSNSNGIRLYTNKNTLLNNLIINNTIGINFTGGSSACNIINTTVLNSSKYDIELRGNAEAYALNCSINFSKINFLSATSKLIVQWYMHVNITYGAGEGAPDANITVSDNFTNLVYRGKTDVNGNCNWLTASHFELVQSGISQIFTPHNVTVWKTPDEGFAEPVMNETKIVYIKLKTDTTTPNPPTNLAFNYIGGSYINMSWSISNSPDVIGYNIYINDTGSSSNFHKINSTINNYFNVTGLVNETVYYFRFRAFDHVFLESQNLSGSNETLDVTPPVPPTGLSPFKVGGTYINLTWSASVSLDTEGYYVYMNDTGSSTNFHFIGETTQTYYNHSGLFEEIKYYFKLKAYDEVPLFSSFSNPVEATTLDITAPTSPFLLKVTYYDGDSINLSWNASNSTDAAGYQVYVNNTGSATLFSYLATTSGLYYNHTKLAEETTYYYKVRTYDEVPFYSSFSNTASATTLDITAPSAPTGLSATNPTGSTISLSWNANPEADIAGYRIYMNDTGGGASGPFKLIHTIVGTTTSYTVTNLLEETTYYFVITAYDEVPFYSPYSTAASATTLDVSSPVIPTGFSAVPFSDTQINLNWDANSELDLAGYSIYMNVTGHGPSGDFYLIHTITGSDTSYSVKNLAEQTAYHFKLTAFDEVPNYSPFTNVASATTLDLTAPQAPTGFVAVPISDTQITLSWEANTEVDLAGYYIYINDTGAGPAGNYHLIRTLSASYTTYTITDLVEQTSYHFKLKAFDDIPNNSTFSPVASATTPDLTAPSTPTGLAAEAIYYSQIKLTWNVNPAADLAGYIIYMNDTGAGETGSYHQIHTLTGKGTTYTVTGLSERTTYYFKLKAFDEVPNYSLFSTGASATTLERARPSAPTGLSVANPTENSLTLNWNANPEPGVIGYYIYRSEFPDSGFIQINSEPVSGIKYVDSGYPTVLKEDATYYYKLKTVDEFNLESDFSATASGKTLLGQKSPVIANYVEDFSIPEDGYDDTTINLFNWFTDPNSDPLTFKCEGQDNIEVVINGEDGSVKLTPKPDWNGQETLTFYASDGISPEFSDTVTITVTPVSDPPKNLKIIEPEDGKKIEKGDKLDFEGSCDDADLPYGDVLKYLWKSDLDGELGTSQTLEDVVLTEGEHIITLEVEDTQGNKISVNINVTVLKPEGPDDGDLDVDGDGKDDSDEGKSQRNLAVGISALVIVLILIFIFYFLVLKKKGPRKGDGEGKEGYEQEPPQTPPAEIPLQPPPEGPQQPPPEYPNY